MSNMDQRPSKTKTTRPTLNHYADGKHDAKNGNSLSPAQIVAKVSADEGSEKGSDREEGDDETFTDDGELLFPGSIGLCEPVEEVFHEEDVGDLTRVVPRDIHSRVRPVGVEQRGNLLPGPTQRGDLPSMTTRSGRWWWNRWSAAALSRTGGNVNAWTRTASTRMLTYGSPDVHDEMSACLCRGMWCL